MEPRDFMYWLAGLLEDSRIKTLDEAQVKMIRDHMALVMTKVTPELDFSKLLQPQTQKTQTIRWPDFERTTLIC